jgi:hypothetical protein
MAVRPDRIILVSHSSDPYKRIKRTRSIVEAVTGHDVAGVIHDGELLYADFQGPESYVGSFPMKIEDYAGLENWIKSKAMIPVHSMHETPASMLAEILA